jgi:hypothetical protein
MNKKGTGMNMGVKILLLVTGLLTLFSGVNELLISTGRESLVRVVTSNVGFTMQILYALMGVGCLVTSIVIAIKIFKRKK